jgi:hypothetical protein
MTRKTDIEALLERVNKAEPKIIEEYNKSLHAKTIGNNLKIDIKDYFSHLRSVLDYLAHDIVEKYCPRADLKDRLYFPIGSDQSSFEGIMRKSYPDLSTNSPKVYSVLESIQPYKKSENIWLSSFNRINNENKHEQLTPQKRTETTRVNVESNNGTSASWNPDMVKFGSGPGVSAFVGGVRINPNTQLPEPSNTQTVTIEKWVDFQFEGTNISAVWLIKESSKYVKGIFNDLKDYI